MGLRFAYVGRPLQTTPETMAAAVEAMLEACRASGVPDEEVLVACEEAWQRTARGRRAATVSAGVEAFQQQQAEQVHRLGMLTALVEDDAVARHPEGRWLGPSQAVLDELSERVA